MPPSTLIARRRCLAQLAAAASALALAGCATLPPFSLEEAVRRLLEHSSARAFARLTERGGYWDRAVAMLGLARLLGVRGELLAGLLTAPPVKARLERAFAAIAEEGAYRAAPVVTDAVRVIGIANARAILDGGPSAATDFLRSEMGGALIEELAPELAAAIRAAEDPLVGQALALLTGVDAAGLARNAARTLEGLIWHELAAAEAAIRVDPGATGDPLIIGALGGGRPPAPR